MHEIPSPCQLLLHAGITALCMRFPHPANYYCMQGSQLCARDSLSLPIIIACRDHSSVHEIPSPCQLLLHAGITALCMRFPHPANYYCMQGSQLCARDSLSLPIIIACRDHSSVHEIPSPYQLLLHAGITALCMKFPLPANYYCMQGSQLCA